jgi:RNA polymerase sigma factor (sigma-70 family)
MEQMSTAGLTARLRWRRSPALRSQTARADPAALAAMYERHHQALYRYCRSILHDEEDARDALQSTMAKAVAALRDERRDFELRPWLFRIAHNEAISRLRQRREVVDLDAVGTLGTDSLTQTLEDRERLALLRADLHDLPERQRMALVLRELSGLSHEEIAGVLDSTAPAVKQTIFEARSGLQECAEGRTMLCADVQRALSDGDGRVLRGRRMRAHVRSCRACRQFKTALAQRPADLAALAPALPTAGAAALLAHLLPGAKASLASAGTAAGTGGGVVATVATKAAIVAVAAATVAGAGTVVRDDVTARDRAPRPPATAPPTSGTRTASAPAPGHPAAAGHPGGAPARRSASADRHASRPSRPAPATSAPAARALAAQTSRQRPGANGTALAQTKRPAAASNGRGTGPNAARRPPARHASGRPAATPAPKARPAHPEHPAIPAARAQPGAQDPGRPADTTPPAAASGAAHAAK